MIISGIEKDELEVVVDGVVDGVVMVNVSV